MSGSHVDDETIQTINCPGDDASDNKIKRYDTLELKCLNIICMLGFCRFKTSSPHSNSCLLFYLIITTVLLIISGSVLITVYILFSDHVDAVRPLVIVGAVLLASSVVMVTCILELSFR